MAMSTLESIMAEAQTNAALARSAMLSAQSSADSATATQSDLNILASTPTRWRLASPMIRRPWPTPLPWSRRRARRPSPPSIRRCGRSRTRPESASAELPSAGHPEGTTEETGKDSTGETPTGTVSEEPAAKAVKAKARRLP